MASMFGVKPESLVVGAFAGKFDWSSTAMTWEPAPIANSISVALGDNEMTRCGWCAIVTVAPPGSVIETGKRDAGGELEDVGDPPHDAARKTKANATVPNRMASFALAPG